MPVPEPWREPPPSQELAAGAVDIWLAWLDQPAPVLEALGRSLAPDEQARAARFHFERDRRHYAAGRGMLRDILARYLGLRPAELRFTYGPQGKPALLGQPLQFNLAHSGGLALYAVARDLALGVDVEQRRQLDDLVGIAERFFAPEECQALLGLPPERQHEGFFACWSRKEAFIKTSGMGLSMPLDQFAVALDPQAPCRLLHIAGDGAAAAEWTLLDLPCPPGYSGALSVQGVPAALSYWRWAGCA